MGNWIEALLAYEMVEKLGNKKVAQMTREEIWRSLFDPTYKDDSSIKSEHQKYNGGLLPPEAPKINFVPNKDTEISSTGWAGYDPGIKSYTLPTGQSYVFSRDKCDHKWVSYTGLFEAYDFCERCDKKKETK